MAIKKTEIAARVFEMADALPLEPLHGGALAVPVADLASLSLAPWFCDVSVQWAIRITDPNGPLKKNAVGKVPNSYPSVSADGRVLIGIPGDGIEPRIYSFTPVAEAVAQAVKPGMTLELASANLGVVKRDWEVKAESSTTNGDQRYAGTVTADGAWAIERSSPALTRGQLDTAIDCGRKFVTMGPWDVKDREEAEAILMLWLSSPQANINIRAVQQLWTLRGLRFEDSGTDEQRRGMGGALGRKLCGLALGYFRHRLAGGPFRWDETGGYMPTSEAERRAVAQAVMNPAG